MCQNFSTRWMLVLFAASAMTCAQAQESATAQESGTAQETAKSDGAAASDDSHYELQVRYAKIRMQLAEIELQTALEMQGNAGSVVPDLVIERLRSNLAVAQEQLAQAEMASIAGPEQIRLRQAEERVRLAELDLQSGFKLHELGRASDLEIERLKLRVELAKLSVVIMKKPEHFTTMLQYVEAKVDRLGKEILSLDQRISKLEPVRGFLPK